MARLSMNEVRCEVLFASALQPSDSPTCESVGDAIGRTVRELGLDGCVGRMAEEFGNHPHEARGRMRWARQLVDELHAASAAGATGLRAA